MNILLVEDDADIVRTLSELLAQEGYALSLASRQDQAIELALNAPCDLVLLDVTLAQGNGFAVCSAVKDARPDLPVVFLTASGDEFNTVAGLNLGADDYVAKPFRPRELLARIAAVLRRKHHGDHPLRLGNLSVDPSRARVTRGDEEVALSAVEYRLILLFALHAGKVVTRDMMREALWEDAAAYVEDNTLSVYVRRLREKLEDDPAAPTLIRTVRGIGYVAG